MSIPLDVVGFPDQDFCHISVATQIPDDAELIPIHPAGNRIRDRWIWGSDSILYKVRNCWKEPTTKELKIKSVYEQLNVDRQKFIQQANIMVHSKKSQEISCYIYRRKIFRSHPKKMEGNHNNSSSLLIESISKTG